MFNNANDSIYQSVKNNIIPSGIEFYLPLFFEATNSLFDYLNPESIICYNNGLSGECDDLLGEFDKFYTKSSQILDYQSLSVDKVFLQKDEFFQKLNNFKQFVYQRDNHNTNIDANTKLAPAVQVLNKSLQKLESFLQTTNKKVLISVASTSRLALLADLLDKNPQHLQTFAELEDADNLTIIISPILYGFSTENLVILTEENIFGTTITSQKRRRRAKHKDFDEAIKSLIEINEGDAIVHENYGVGRYLGLRTQIFDDLENDFIEIEYSGGAKLLISIDEIGLISRYSGGLDNPPLHKLGTQTWNKAKKKAMDSMRDVASELLKIYAARELETGFGIDEPSSEYYRFVDNFEFIETPDQIKASADILNDMLSQKPMDRLVCGDVGFGKTEIAMRAAFLAVENNTQVAILVPTTLLANQHQKSFLDRFTGFAINIKALSRFQTAKEQTEIKKNLENGEIDIIIGTHKLIQNTIKYQNLGSFRSATHISALFKESCR